jgi:small subunit ribosomal protein S4e
MHLNRKSIPKSWPISKKEHPYIHVPKSSNKKEHSISLVVILRDMLKRSQNFKETKKIIQAGEIKVNGKVIKNEKCGVGLFDIVQIEKLNKSYILILTEGGDLDLKETKENTFKIAKVVGKKVQNKNLTQVNLMGGINLLTKEKMNVNDSVVLDLNKKQITKVLPLKKDSHCFITSGKWVGKIGKIENLKGRKADITLENKKILDIPLKNLIVVDKELKW